VTKLHLGWVVSAPARSIVDSMMKAGDLAMRNWARRITATLGVCAATLLVSGTAQAAFPGTNGRIVVSSGLGTNDIFVMRPDGSHRQQLTHVARSWQDCVQPAFSPSGKRIAYVQPTRQGGSGIHLMREDGSRKRHLDLGRLDAQSPAFSPSGKRLVFEGHNGRGNWDIYVVRTDGTHLRRITHGRAAETMPSFSPNGERIAYSSGPLDGGAAIMTMRPDGTAKRRLTGIGQWFRGSPNFSPNGARIVFDAEYVYGGEPERRRAADVGRGIWVMRADGTNKTRLAGAYNSSPVFSPNGHRIAFWAQRGIHLIRANGSDEQRIGQKRDQDPDWGPGPGLR
jgi:Tol biopolymer transport system component